MMKSEQFTEAQRAAHTLAAEWAEVSPPQHFGAPGVRPDRAPMHGIEVTGVGRGCSEIPVVRTGGASLSKP